jgi:hypothetical protein
MVNYNNGKIYKIEAINGEEGDIYIGSTTKELLSQRMTAHRCNYKYWLKCEVFKISSYILFEKYGVENCRIVLIENVNATSLDELKAREAFYIKSMLCINKNIPMRTKKEWREDNKETLKEYQKLYCENNKENKKEYSKWYRENNKEKIKETKKLYNENNKEKIKETNKLYHETNKEKAKETNKLCREKKHDEKLKALTPVEDYLKPDTCLNKDYVKSRRAFDLIPDEEKESYLIEMYKNMK